MLEIFSGTKAKLFAIVVFLFLIGAASNSVSAVTVTPAAVQTAGDNDYTRINNALQTAVNGDTITLSGTFDWTNSFAAASWALGSDGISQGGGGDDYSLLVPANLNGVTFTASSLGAATIQGPGDLAAVNLEGVLVFDGGDNQNWTISNIRFLDFDLSIGMFNGAGGSDAFNNTLIQNNYIRIPNDLNATVAPADVNQNIGIHYSFGTNQTISGNTIDTPGDGVSAAPNFSSVVGMQSNTSGGAVYNDLQITNNTINILNAQNNANPQTVLGIWENSHAHSSNITVSGNQFLSVAAGNNPSVNLLRGFRVTSHSSATTTVAYSNNSVEGANIGFQWIAGSNFAGNQPVRLTSNVIRNGATGVLVQSNGLANLSFNRIVGNSASGVENIAGSTTTAENNWWGCNYGPGAGGADCSGTANGTIGTVDANPWLTLRTSATPNAIVTGGNSSISSNLNFNSDNVNTSGSGNVPNGTPASFAGTLGTVSPPTGTTTNGVTGTTFTAGAAAGAGNAATTIDAQTVNAPITITFSCNNVSIPTGATALRNTQFVVPINVDSTTGRGILSYDFTLTYDPAVITPVQVETAGTMSAGWTITTNGSSGTLIVSGFNISPLTGSGVLLNVRFVASGAIGTTSGLNFSSFAFNEGVPCVNTSNGNVTVISGTVSGTVTYANALTTTPVQFATINAAGSIPQSTSTDVNGNYSLSGFGTGAYTVTPSKANQVNGITNLDASRVAQHVVGFAILNSTQLIAADVSGNGSITSLDAAYIAQFVALISNPGNTGTWKFIPPNRGYANVEANFTGQDYSAILMGEVTGNWDPSGPLRPSTELETKEKRENSDSLQPVVTVTAPLLQYAATGSNFTVLLTASDTTQITTNDGIIGYQFDLFYTSSAITPQAVPCDLSGTISSNLSILCNPIAPGHIIVVVFGTMPITGAGTLMKLKFFALGPPGATSPLTIQNFMFNEGVPQDITVNGNILIVGPTAAAVSIGGRLTTATGLPVSKATVYLTDTRGQVRTTLSNGFGLYTFEDVTVGETYIVSVLSKRYTFTPVAISPTDSTSELNLIAEP